MSAKQEFQSFQRIGELVGSAERNQYGEDLASCGSDHGAFGVAGGAAVGAEIVGEEWQAFQIQIVFSNSFVGFAGAAGPKCDVAVDICQVVQANGQAALYAHDINDVHDGVNSWQAFSS